MHLEINDGEVVFKGVRIFLLQ